MNVAVISACVCNLRFLQMSANVLRIAQIHGSIVIKFDFFIPLRLHTCTCNNMRKALNDSVCCVKAIIVLMPVYIFVLLLN